MRTGRWGRFGAGCCGREGAILLPIVLGAAVVLLCPAGRASAEAAGATAASSDASETQFAVIPGPFYNPNEGLGLTVIPMLQFHLSQDDAVSPPSLVAVPVMFAVQPPISDIGTRYSYALGAAGQLFLDEDRWRMKGLAGYANLFRQFRGIGGDTSATPLFDYREMAAMALVQVMRQLGWKPLYGGLILGYVAFRTETADPANQAILESLGTGADWSGDVNVGLAVQIDTKNNQYYPSSGVDFNLRTYGSFKSGAEYLVLEPNLNHFLSLSGGDRLVFAYRLFGQLGFGEVPLSYYAYYGSHGTTVGYYSGDFVDKMMAGADAELRWLFWWRLGAAAGGGLGKVFPSFDGFGSQPWLPSGWISLLYQVMQASDIRVHLTLAIGKSDPALYFGVGQTF